MRTSARETAVTPEPIRALLFHNHCPRAGRHHHHVRIECSSSSGSDTNPSHGSWPASIHPRYQPEDRQPPGSPAPPRPAAHHDAHPHSGAPPHSQPTLNRPPGKCLTTSPVARGNGEAPHPGPSACDGTPRPGSADGIRLQVWPAGAFMPPPSTGTAGGRPRRRRAPRRQARRPKRASSSVWASAWPGTGGRAAIAPALR